MPDLGWSQHIRRREQAEFDACTGTAAGHGISVRQAMNECDAAAPFCNNCPFAKKCPDCDCACREEQVVLREKPFYTIGIVHYCMSCNWNDKEE